MRFFFLNLRDSDGVVTDHDGYLCEDLAAAVTEATAGARLLMGDQLRAGRGATMDRQFEITDQTGQVLAKIRFWDALQDLVIK